MGDTVTDHGGSQGVPSLLDDVQAIVTYSQPTQPLQPTNRSFNHPTDSAQAAAMRCLSTSDQWFDAQPAKQMPGIVAVVAAVGQENVRLLRRPTWFAAHHRVIQNDGQDLRVIAGVGTCRANGQRDAMPVDKQGVFGAQFSAVHRAGTGVVAASHCPNAHAIDDRRMRIQLTSFSQQLEPVHVQAVPNAQLFPPPQSAMRRATRAVHFSRHILPATAGAQHKPNDPHHGDMGNLRATALWSHRLLWRQMRFQFFHKLVRHLCTGHDASPPEVEKHSGEPGANAVPGVLSLLLRGMGQAGGKLNYINPVCWALLWYYRAYSLLAAGFSRSREFLANRMAASLYGKDAFIQGLKK